MSKKALVVYFTWTNGNTERIAKALQQALQADILKITAPDDYHEDYDTVVRKSQEEIRRGYRPRVEPAKVDLSGYDTVAIGSPTWWYTIAPPMSTFLEANDFAGKTVVPFATNGGWPGRVIKDMKAACPGAVGEAANVAELLMSDKGAFITGSTFLIDGGATASYFYGPLRPEKA